MSRIDSIFQELRSKRRAALMPFITAGYPSLDATASSVAALERAGASIVELGIPFSDPIADGPVIAASMHDALEAGVTPPKVFDLVKRLRSGTRMGLIAMVSDSIITKMGPERFVHAVADAGFDGLIVPDIDLEAAKPLAGLARLHQLSFTLLIAPTTSPERIKHITDLCSGFIYLLARVGITGESNQMDTDLLRARIAQIRAHSDLPVAVGFGISRAEHVSSVAGIADAAIVGSALVRRMAGLDATRAARAAGDFIADLARGIDSGTGDRLSTDGWRTR